MSNSRTELSKPIQLKRIGPDGDQAARLTLIYTMSESGYSIEDIAETLDMLALLPGQEAERGVFGTATASRPGEPACLPSNQNRTYVPN